MVILVTGAFGQLGQALQFVASDYPDCQFIFTSSSDLDISNAEIVTRFFETNKVDYCINAAAYTAVDKAETNTELAKKINVFGAKNLAVACKNFGTTLLHVSTDFVFDGTANQPYLETDTTNPINVYGQTKLDGELEIIKNLENYYIIRTSWVYSQFATNFMKTMLRLAQEKDSLSIVSNQIGTPTNAVDLAKTLLSIVAYNQQPTSNNQPSYGIYNFSNEGTASWYDFAKEIFRINNVNIDLKAIPSEAFPTPAIRPKYSVLDKSKIKETFGLHIKTWEESLLQIL